MRDDRNKWPHFGGLESTCLTGENVKVGMIQINRQTMISGAVGVCLSLCGVKTAVAGGTDIASGNSYALRQRRDRLLVVNGPAVKDGWHSDLNVAASDMSAAYAVISLAGSNAEQVISTGTEFASGLPSPSVTRLWHGFGILLYRYGSVDTYRMHVRAAHLEAVWEMIDRQIGALAGVNEVKPPYDQVANGNSEASFQYVKAS